MMNGIGNGKQCEVVDRLRDRIVSGQLAPGAKLPTYDQLESSFSVSRGTLFHAIRELKEDGLLQSEGRRGIFVSKRSPHLYRYGLVMPELVDPDDPLHGAYLAAANALKKAGVCEIVVFNDPDENVCNDEYMRLLGDVQSHRVAGLLFFGRPWPKLNLSCSPVLHADRVPCIAMTAHVRPAYTAMRLDMIHVIEKGCRWLRERGRQRVAVLMRSKIETLPQPMDLPSLVRPHGLMTQDRWCAVLGVGGEATAGSFVQLLMDSRGERPDSLFLLDDHLVPAAARALVAEPSVTVGENFDVVSLCNWPWVPETVLPIRWLGFDAQVILRQAMDLIDRARAGEELPHQVSIGSHFAEERPSLNHLFNAHAKTREQADEQTTPEPLTLFS